MSVRKRTTEVCTEISGLGYPSEIRGSHLMIQGSLVGVALVELDLWLQFHLNQRSGVILLILFSVGVEVDLPRDLLGLLPDERLVLWRQLYKNRSSRRKIDSLSGTIFKRIGLPEDLFSY